jgi:hypothetical protein
MILNMDAELVEMLEEEFQRYSDDAKIAELLNTWKNLGLDFDEKCVKVFMIGSVYGSCLFILNSFNNYSSDEKIKEEFVKTFYSHIRGLEQLYKHYLQKLDDEK